MGSPLLTRVVPRCELAEGNAYGGSGVTCNSIIPLFLRFVKWLFNFVAALQAFIEVKHGEF